MTAVPIAEDYADIAKRLREIADDKAPKPEPAKLPDASVAVEGLAWDMG